MMRFKNKKLEKLWDKFTDFIIIGGYSFICLVGLGIYMLVAVRTMKNHETYMTSDGTIMVGETKADYKPWIIKETEVKETEVNETEATEIETTEIEATEIETTETEIEETVTEGSNSISDIQNTIE